MGWCRVEGWLLFQTIIYFVILTCGLTTSISSGLVLEDFGGTCVLYGNVNCTALNSTTSCIIYGGQLSICTFITAVNILVSVLFAMMLCGYHLYFVVQSKTFIRVINQMWVKMLLVSTVLAAFVTLVAACTLSVGTTQWCSAVESAAHREDIDISSCGESQTFHWYAGNSKTALMSERYYHLYSAAQTTCWISVVLWLVESIVYVRHLFKTRQQQRSFQDPFTIEDFDTFT